MTGSQAIKLLECAGYVRLRNGRGCHVIMQKGPHRVVVSNGTSLSPGMTGKVKSALKK